MFMNRVDTVSCALEPDPDTIRVIIEELKAVQPTEGALGLHCSPQHEVIVYTGAGS